MDVRIETLPAVEVSTCRRLGAYPESAPKAWHALWTWAKEKNLASQVKELYGLSHDNPLSTPDERCRYDACMSFENGAVADADAGIEMQSLPGGRYALYRHVGPYAKIGELFRQLDREWLHASEERWDKRRPHLEIYAQQPSDTPEAELITDLAVPIEG